MTTYAIGIDLGGTKIEAGLVSSQGEIISQIKQPTKTKEGLEATLQQIADIILEITKTSPIKIKGVGIGIPGQVNPNRDKVLFAPNLKWQDVWMIEKLNQLVPLPIYIDNDVRTATRGEKYFGAGKGCSNFVCLFLGTGIGGGIVINHTIYPGNSNTAGEFGHMVVQMNGPLCTCGNKGCLESFSSGWAIAQKAQEMLTPDSLLFTLAHGKKEAITAKLVYQAAHQNDSIAVEIIQTATTALIAGVTSIVNAWNPQKIIIGGGQLKGYGQLIEILRKELPKHSLKAACQDLEIVSANSNNNSSIWGGASLVFEALNDKKC